MGVFAEAWIPNKLDLESIRALPAVLNEACRGPELWIWDPSESRGSELWIWELAPHAEYDTMSNLDQTDSEWCCVWGLGFIIHVYPNVIIVHSPVRWRGFLSYPDLRSRNRTVTARIVQTLGATEIVWLPDWFLDEWPEADPITMTVDSVRGHLLADWGHPQPSLDSVDELVVPMTEHSSPKVWLTSKTIGHSTASSDCSHFVA
jgi:hypothetical protein